MNVLLLSLEQHGAEEVEEALPAVVLLEHLDELLAREPLRVLASRSAPVLGLGCGLGLGSGLGLDLRLGLGYSRAT